MSEASACVQIVERHRPRHRRFLRSNPYTALNPHNGQIQHRMAVAKAAEKAKGKKGLAPNGLPWAAHYVQQETSRQKISNPTPSRPPLWAERMEKFRRTLLAEDKQQNRT